MNRQHMLLLLFRRPVAGVPDVLGEAVFLIESERPNGPPLNIPLFGAVFWIDAIRETY